MPELPEVETVRAGLQRWVTGRTVLSVADLHPRAVRRHLPGPDDLAGRLAGRTIASVQRRGKYLWFVLGADSRSGRSDALVAHLGMSGQLLLSDAGEAGPHLRARFTFDDGGAQLWFRDQRTFGGLHLDDLIADGPTQIPASIAHIGRDPLDPFFDDEQWIRRLRLRNTTIKRSLLDQSSMSGVGNIYADESLWRARLHGDRLVARLSPAQLRILLAELRAVMTEALAVGGTSFDALYVNVNGQSGYFDRSLNVYGRSGLPCLRCATPIRRTKWMNRSSYFCPVCQVPPRRARKQAPAGAGKQAPAGAGKNRTDPS